MQIDSSVYKNNNDDHDDCAMNRFLSSIRTNVRESEQSWAAKGFYSILLQKNCTNALSFRTDLYYGSRTSCPSRYVRLTSSTTYIIDGQVKGLSNIFIRSDHHYIFSWIDLLHMKTATSVSMRN